MASAMRTGSVFTVVVTWFLFRLCLG
jgi:hypothetical protein